MKTKMERGILLLEAMVASLVTMVPIGSAQAGIEGLKGINLFLFLSYITLGLSLLLFILAFVYLIKRMKAGLRIVTRKRRDREEEIIEMVRGIKELKKKIEERGESLTSISDVFLISMLFVIISMI